MQDELAAPVISVVSVSDRGNGLVGVLLRLPNGRRVLLVVPRSEATVTRVRFAAAAVLSLSESKRF